MLLVLRNNAFRFGYTYCIQKKVTAIGTPLVVFYANIVMGHHKKTLIPKHKPQLALLRRLVDNQFGIFVPTSDKKTLIQNTRTTALTSMGSAH